MHVVLDDGDCDVTLVTDLFEQIDGTLAASLVIQYLIKGKIDPENIYRGTLANRLQETLSCTDKVQEQSYFLLTILYAAGHIMMNGPHKECSEVIANVIKKTRSEPRRLNFDKYMQKAILDVLEKDELGWPIRS